MLEKENENIKENEETLNEKPLEEKVEVPCEEKQVEPEHKKEEKVNVKKGQKQVVEEIVNIEKPSDLSKPYYELVEEERLKLFGNYKTQKKINNIVMVGIVALIITALVLMSINPSLKIVGYSIAGATLIALLVYYIFTKKKFPDSTKEYIKKVTTIIDQNVFASPRFTETTVNMKEKIKINEINCDKVYRGIVDMGSRNIVHGKYDGKTFSVGELALYKGSGKKGQNQVAFLGKYLSVSNDLEFDGRYILVKKGALKIETPVNRKTAKETGNSVKVEDKIVDQPSDIEDLSILYEEDKIIIYGPKDGKYSKDLGTKFVGQFKNFDVDKCLVNLVACIWAGHSAYYLSYDDPVISLPFERPFNKDPQDQYKNNLENIFNLNNLLCK